LSPDNEWNDHNERKSKINRKRIPGFAAVLTAKPGILHLQDKMIEQ
jgi:hypothetical protein